MKCQTNNHYKNKIFSLENNIPTLWTKLTSQPEESCEVTKITADKLADIKTADYSLKPLQGSPASPIKESIIIRNIPNIQST